MDIRDKNNKIFIIISFLIIVLLTIIIIVLNSYDKVDITSKLYSNITLKCNIDNVQNYPKWIGPKNFTNRFSYDVNKKDIIITNISYSDTGIYFCYNKYEYNYKINLIVI